MKCRFATLLVILALLASKSVHAQSFGIELLNNVMPASGGMAGASIASPQDLQSAIDGNPATLTQYRGAQFGLSGAWIEPTYNLTVGRPGLPLIGVAPFTDAKSDAQGLLAPTLLSRNARDERAETSTQHNLEQRQPPETTAYDIGMYTIDAHWKLRGLSVIAEYYWRCLANFRGGDVPGLSDRGFNLQMGKFVVPAKLELLARWSRITGNSGTLGAMDQSTDEVGVGAAWYIKGNNAKFVLDASRVNGMPLFSPRLDVLPGSEGWLLRTQLQFGF